MKEDSMDPISPNPIGLAINRVLFRLTSFLNNDQARDRVRKTLSAQMVSTVLVTVGQFLQAPLLLRFWTTETYTLWLLLFTVPTLLWTFETGIGQILSDDFSRAWAENDRKKLGHLEGLGITIYLLLTATSAALLFGIAMVLEKGGSSIVTSLEGQLFAVVGCLCLFLVGGFTICYVRGNLRALHKNYLGTYLLTAVRATELISPALALLVGGRILTALMILAGSTLLTAVVGLVFLKNLRREYGFPPPQLSTRGIQKILRRSVFLQSNQFATLFFQQATFSVARTIFSPTAALSLSLGRTAARAVLTPALMLTTSVAPELCAKFTSQNRDEIRSVFQKVSKVLNVYVFVAVFVLCLGLPFAAPLWSAHALRVSWLDAFCIGIIAALQVSNLGDTTVLNADNKYIQWASISTGVMLLSTGLLIWAFKSLGQSSMWPLLVVPQVLVNLATRLVLLRNLPKSE